MSTELVPYAQMEKMAITVAKSGMFGIKTADQALTLMALCQAEGIHPMTAVRDYHIIQGRPSLKAETMLARFMAAGGKVQWHELTDKKAEATFTHPDGGSVRLDWTIERAAQAKLTTDMWTKYPRPMLRSRLISEGVRTVCPSIVQGVYTPEETQAVNPEAPSHDIAAAVRNGELRIMADDVAGEWIDSLKEAATPEQLRIAYQAAHKAAVAAKDGPRIGEFSLAYEARKEELATVPSGEQP